MTDTIATTETREVRMPKLGDAAEIERRLRAGDDDSWLTPGEIARLFGRHRSSVDRWLNSDKGVRIGKQRLKIRTEDSPGGHRRSNPEDVIALLDAWRESRSRARQSPPPSSPDTCAPPPETQRRPPAQ